MFDSSPVEWSNRTLGEATEAVLTGPFGSMLHEHDYTTGGTPVVNPTNIHGGKIISDPAKTLSDSKARGLSSFAIREGDILLGRRGEIGRCAAVSAAEDGWVCGTGCFIIRPGPNTDTHFLTALLGSAGCRNKLESLASGVTMLNLGNKAVQGMELLLPPIEEQRRIAEVLRSVEENISINSEALRQVRRARSAILHAAFVESEWEPVPLGSLGRWQSGSTPSKGVPENWGGGIPWVCPRDMKVPLISKTSETISKHALGGSCRLAPPRTLILVVRGMILARTIPTAITVVEAAYNQDIKAFIPNGRASPRFVEICIRHQERDLLRLVNTATHGTKKLDSDTIGAIQIPLPDPDAQDALVATITRLDEAAADYADGHLRLLEVRRGLLSDLLSGRVRVPA